MGRGLRGARLAAGVFQDFIPVIVKVGQLRQVRLLYVPQTCVSREFFKSKLNVILTLILGVCVPPSGVK